MKELVKNEIDFCNQLGCDKNEHGQFIVQSKSGKSIMNLPYILLDYKQYLIENKIIKEVS
jgi:hypothetical protein